METPAIHGQLLLRAVGATGGTTGLPLSQQAAATHISVLIWQHPGAGYAPSGSPLMQGPTDPRARAEHPWAQLHAASLLFLNILLCPVFQAFPPESLCCWWRRPGPFWVSVALEAHPALLLGDVWGVWRPLEQHPAKCLSGGSCSVPIVRDQLTVAKAQCGSNIIIRSCLLHR